MSFTVLDPTGEQTQAHIPFAERASSLEGKTVALLDISKPRGNVFLDHIEKILNDQHIQTKRYRKPTYTKPAPIDLRHQIATECQAVIEALAD